MWRYLFQDGWQAVIYTDLGHSDSWSGPQSRVFSRLFSLRHLVFRGFSGLLQLFLMFVAVVCVGFLGVPGMLQLYSILCSHKCLWLSSRQAGFTQEFHVEEEPR